MLFANASTPPPHTECKYVSSRRSSLCWLQNLSPEVDNKALYDTFSQFGKILSSKIATGPGGESKGHGFVQYEDEASAQAAIDTVNGKELVGQQVFVGPFKRREDRDTGVDKFTNLYVKNLDESVTDSILQEVFGEIGPLNSAIVMKDDEGKSKGFGFVNYEKSEDAHTAVEKLNGHKHEETEWEVTKAQKKAEREAELKAKFEKVQSVSLMLQPILTYQVVQETLISMHAVIHI